MIRLRAFGSVDLQGLDGRSLRAIHAQPKRLALLAYLASTRGTFHRRDTLLAVFWPELDTRRARAALNQAVRFLRKELGDTSVLVSRGDDELGVDEQRFWFDVAAFRGAIEAGNHAEALDLYRGDLLEGFFVDGETEFQNWLERERARLRGMAARAARQLAETREADERFTTAVVSARRAVELSDADERGVRALLELLDRLGDRAGAIHAYEEFARRLASDFDAQPADETKALIAGIRGRVRKSPAAPSLANASPKAAVTHVAVAARTTTFAPPRDIAGTELNGWQIVRELGRGGMATVYLAKDLKHDRHVALKVMHPELTSSIGADRFLREIQIMARLAHPHILPLIDSGAAAGTLYLVAPFVEGESLKERISRDGRLPVDDALRFTREIARALDYAHRHGVVHRDIKPANVLLQDGQALVADFGIARALRAAESERVTTTGLSPGTPAYMSPEQAAGETEIDGRSDVYSLGAMLYEMLTGNPPHLGPDAQSVLAKVITEPVAPVRSVRGDVPEHVEAALVKALSQNAGDRYESAGAFADALTATPPHTSGSRPVWGRRAYYRRVAYALAVPGAALVAWGMLATLGSFGIGPSATLLSRGVLRHGQPVLITSFRVAGLDSSIGDAVAHATRTALEESRIVYAVPSDVVSGALERMRLSPQSRLDLVRAREVALREGIRAIIDGHVIRVGERFDVGLRFVSADSGADLVSLRATAGSLDDVIPTLDKLIRRLRGSIGESLASVRASPPLPRITTHSMEALRLYAVANIEPDYNKARVLLEQAVKADTEFAEGWRKLAVTLFNLGISGPVRDSAEKNAYRYRFNASQIERLRIEARNTGTDRAKSIAIWEQLLALGDSNNAQVNLAENLRNRREFARAEFLYRLVVRRRPTSQNTTNLAEKLVEQGKLDEADSVLRLPVSPAGALLVWRWKATVLYHRGQLDAYERALDSLRSLPSQDGRPNYFRVNLALLRGRLRDWQSLRAAPRTGLMNFARPLQVGFLEESLVELFIRADTARALKTLHRADSALPVATPRRRYLYFGLVYALAGRADSARALLERFENSADTAFRGDDRAIMHRVRGQIASIDGRVNEALEELRRGDLDQYGPIDACSVCLQAQLGDVFDRAHMGDSAVVMYEQFVNTVNTGHLVEDHWNLPRILNRLGELHEARGDRAKAIDYYSRFVELWKRADPELQPRVSAVRQRLARLKNGTN